MRYLIKHYNCYYYKRKIPKTKNNLVLSLQTTFEEKAKFITAIINIKRQFNSKVQQI